MGRTTKAASEMGRQRQREMRTQPDVESRTRTNRTTESVECMGKSVCRTDLEQLGKGPACWQRTRLWQRI